MHALQVRYSALQLFYYVLWCVTSSFATILMHDKGLANAQVGVVTAVGCAVNILLAPRLSQALVRRPQLTIARVFDLMFVVMAVLYTVIVLVDLPAWAVMVAYIAVYGLAISAPPLISEIVIDCMRAGRPLNFGLARGCGSVSYAVSAALLGQAVGFVGTAVLIPVFVVSAVAVLVLAHSLPDERPATPPARAEGGAARGAGAFAARYRLLMVLLAGFACAFAASNALTMYLVNIVTSLGGDTSLYGIAVFVMAVSELPTMAAVVRLRRRLGTGALFMIAGGAYLARNFLIIGAPAVWVVLLGLLFQSLSYAILMPLFTYYVNEVCDEADGMMGQTFISLMTTGAGAMAGNLMGGVLQDAFGLGAMYLFVAVMTATGAALLVAGGLAVRRGAPQGLFGSRGRLGAGR